MVLFARLSLIGARTLFFIFNNFPGKYSFFNGATYIKRLINLNFHGKIPNLGYWLFSKTTGEPFGTAYDPISMVGEFYINFGVVGVFMGMFLLGLAIQIFKKYFLAEPNPYRLIFFGIGSVAFIMSFSYSLMGLIFELFFVRCALLFVNVFDTTLKREKFKKC